jgi:hypothetical protein
MLRLISYTIKATLVIGVLALVPILFLTIFHKDIGVEFRQIRQPKPNRFFIGIDISQTINPEVLFDFKGALIERLKYFVGNKRVYYHISVFGVPGCGDDAIKEIVNKNSPSDTFVFSQTVEKKLRRLSIAYGGGYQERQKQLTTPLNCFLENIFNERRGERLIIFSDLVNDDTICWEKYGFPLESALKFGENKKGQIIFLYTTSYISSRYGNPDRRKELDESQELFIKRIKDLLKEGNVRAVFYKIPDDPDKRKEFLQKTLTLCFPDTTFEIIWARVSVVMKSIIGAVRG